MLEAIFKEAETRARRTMEFASAAAHKDAFEHARVVADQVVPQGRRRRSELLAFVDDAVQRLNQVSQRNDLAGAKDEFAALVGQLIALNGRMVELSAHAAATRAAIQYDLAKIDKDVAALRVRVSQRAGEVSAAAAKAHDRAERSKWTWLGGPLVKGIDELIGVFQDGASTEESARRAFEELGRVRTEVLQMESTANALTLLSSGAGELASTVQSVVNGIAVALGHAQNAENDLKEGALLELFCHTALLDLEHLRQDAA